MTDTRTAMPNAVDLYIENLRNQRNHLEVEVARLSHHSAVQAAEIEQLKAQVEETRVTSDSEQET